MHEERGLFKITEIREQFIQKLPVVYMGFFISISMVVYFLLNFRKIENGGYLTFNEGFFLSFGIFAISTLLYTLFTLVFMNIIDPDYADQYQKKILNIVIFKFIYFIIF